MNKYSNRSLKRLESCHSDLQEIMHEAIKVMDITILCGHRDEETQNKAYDKGASLAKWPESEHNEMPSNAVDAAPYPVNWKDTERFARMAGIIEGIAHSKKIPIKWGGDFKNLKDMPHFQRA